MTLTFFFGVLEDSSGLAERPGADHPPVLPAARELRRETVAGEGADEMLLGALHLGPPAHEFG
jgi:hypothetical protein